MYFLGIADLGINLPVLLGQLLSFTFLLVVLRMLVYKPILAMLDERKARIEAGLSAASRGEEQAVQAAQQAAQQLETARTEAQSIVQNAQQVGQRVQEESRQAAQVQQEQMLQRARNEIQTERDAAITELRKEFADLTIAAAEKIIGESLDKRSHQRLIEQALSESTFKEN